VDFNDGFFWGCGRRAFSIPPSPLYVRDSVKRGSPPPWSLTPRTTGSFLLRAAPIGPSFSLSGHLIEFPRWTTGFASGRVFTPDSHSTKLALASPPFSVSIFHLLHLPSRIEKNASHMVRSHRSVQTDPFVSLACALFTSLFLSSVGREETPLSLFLSHRALPTPSSFLYYYQKSARAYFFFV